MRCYSELGHPKWPKFGVIMIPVSLFGEAVLFADIHKSALTGDEDRREIDVRMSTS